MNFNSVIIGPAWRRPGVQRGPSIRRQRTWRSCPVCTVDTEQTMRSTAGGKETAVQATVERQECLHVSLLFQLLPHYSLSFRVGACLRRPRLPR
ncbi:hypothetical protein MRX96_019058 [Rhipicephalus microplus]